MLIDPENLKKSKSLLEENLISRNFSNKNNKAVEILNFQKSPNQIVMRDNKQLDLVYLYADPLVRMTKKIDGSQGKQKPVDVPLDLDAEYSFLFENLKQTNKQFTMFRECISHDTITDVLFKKPKIIHISAHGDHEYDIDKK